MTVHISGGSRPSDKGLGEGGGEGEEGGGHPDLEINEGTGLEKKFF